MRNFSRLIWLYYLQNSMLETTSMPLYYKDEDYPAGPEIQ